MSGLADRKCLPCRGGIPPLTPEECAPLLAQLDGWEVVDGHHLRRTFAFQDFADGLAFVNRLAHVAEEEGHHPDIHLKWGAVTVEIWTHKVDGLTASDFYLAAKADRQFHPEPGPMTQVWQAVDPAHAHLLAGLLDANGIEARVVGEALFAGEGGYLPAEARPTVWVPAADAARAREILETHPSTPPVAPPDDSE